MILYAVTADNATVSPVCYVFVIVDRSENGHRHQSRVDRKY